MDIERIGWLDGKAGVVSRDVNSPKELGGLFPVGNARQTKFFDKPILMGFKTAFDSSLGLRAVGGDDLNTQFFHGTAELGEGFLVSKLLFNGWGAIDFVDAIFVDIERYGTALFKEIFFCGPKQMKGVLHRDEFAVKNAAGGVVDEYQQDTTGATVFKPVMVRAVQLHQHPHTGSALPPSAVLGFVFSWFPKPLANHSLSQGECG